MSDIVTSTLKFLCLVLAIALLVLWLAGCRTAPEEWNRQRFNFLWDKAVFQKLTPEESAEFKRLDESINPRTDANNQLIQP